jgi:MarR family transcriptional regulator, organic hydroperoxide resistance regulator
VGTRSDGTRREQVGGDGVLPFLRLLWAIDQGLQGHSRRMEKDLGVTGPQRLVIRMVGAHPGLTPGELATQLHLHPSTVTGIVKRLLARGLVKRRVDTEDRRRLLFDLTPKGKRVYNVRRGTIEAVVERALQRIEGADRAAAERALAVLGDELAAE